MSWFWAVLAALAAAYAWRQHVLRVRAQDELDRLSVRGESMRRVLEHLDEGALLLSQSGEVVYANAAALHLLGARQEAHDGPPTLEKLTSSRPILDAVAGHRCLRVHVWHSAPHIFATLRTISARGGRWTRALVYT